MLISIIILSWNRKEEIFKTLEGLKNQTYTNLEIIVVDQASTDGADFGIEYKFTKVKLIRLHRNLGVPGGRNVGAANAKGDILVFLDNDASLEKDALDKIKNKFEKDKDLGIIGFKILSASSHKLDLGSWVYQKNKIKDADKEFLTYTYCGCGHAMRKEIFEKVGYYWDELFFSWEEVEFSLRVLANGFKIIFYPNVVVYHRKSNECRTFNSRHECLRLRNSLWVSWRYLPRLYALRETVVRILVYSIKSLREHCFLMMLIYLLMAFKKFYLLLIIKNRLSYKFFNSYEKLTNRGGILEQLKTLCFE